MNSHWKRVGAALVLAAVAQLGHAWNRTPATTFATLPAGAAFPEGIAVQASTGEVYVASFNVRGAAGEPGQVFVFGEHGHLLRTLSVQGSSTFLLGLDFHPTTGKLLVIDFGNQQVLIVDPYTGASSPFTKVPGGASAGPNALTFDAAGNVYISDSFQGTIWRTPPTGGTPSNWLTSPLLQTSGVPPFGANGMAFNAARSAMFVANTGNDTIVKVPFSGGTAGTPAVFVNSVNGADGLIIDDDDNLWVAANQADEIVVIDSSGRVIAKLGDFNGLDSRGAPKGLLFPASLARHGEFIYVTNLALDLRLFGLPQPVDAQWAADVKRHTVAKIRARIPRVSGLPGSRSHDDD